MLRKDELAAPRPAGPDLPQLAQLRRQLALGAAIELEARDRMVEGIGHQRKDRPPVAGRARVRPRFLHRVALAEQHLVDGPRKRMRVVPADFSQSRHVLSLFP